jgi:SagB-type dehydrogenase family enzyme
VGLALAAGRQNFLGAHIAEKPMKLKSATCQQVYWEDGDLRIVNYLTRRTFSANAVVLEVIRFFLSPRTIRDALLEFSSYDPESVGKAITDLIDAELLLEDGSAGCQKDSLVDSSWKPWLPEGGFHFLTKDAVYVAGDRSTEERMQAVPRTPSPSQFKSIVGADSIALPSLAVETDSFFATLYARRTHRSFADGNVSLDQISRLLGTTWGVQGYLESVRYGKLPLKTSPSGGARHPVEVYLMALKVDGLEPGMYHYQAKDHLLEAISRGASPCAAREYCADQPYVADAAALFIMTAVFSRSMWKYRHPRAYRVVLLDAGHLGQTFCLTATRMGLAPFSTAALKDSLIETDLGIDGVSESVLYVVGVGLPADRPVLEALIPRSDM